MTPASRPFSLQDIQKACLPVIEARLGQFFDRMKAEGFGCNAEMSRYHFASGGKRLRALVPCWVYAAYGQDPLAAVPLGCALELIHNATLVHDDLQDRDTVRRGMPTVWVKHSEPQAINCGDALFFFAEEMLFELEVSPDRFKQVMRRISRGTLQVIEGQAQEFLMKDEAMPSLDRYFEVVRGKTAALIATAIVSALDALGAREQLGERFCERVAEAAMDAGVLFQIQDDLLDIYGEKQRDRKATDIAEGKVSALVACLNGKASASEKALVSEVLCTPREQTSDQQIAQVIGLFEKYDIRGVLVQKLREIQRAVRDDAELRAHPGIQELMIELNERFLDPIRHLMT
jgi:geranylgeranyl diphosphate synthase, type I